MTYRETIQVQQALIALGLYHGNADGIAGPQTISTIKAFQKGKGLTVDGIVGPITYNALLPKQLQPPISTGTFYRGNAKPLEPGDVEEVAKGMPIETALLKAFLTVESNGAAFDRSNRPTILYEPHLAYRFASEEVRQELLNAGLAYAKWGMRPYPKTSDERYAQVVACAKIGGDELAADSTSWGSPQICGFNAKAAGYDTAVSMVRAFAADEQNQIAAMAAFILNNASLYNALKRHDFDTAASLYNGAGWRKNNYGAKLASAYRLALKG